MGLGFLIFFGVFFVCVFFFLSAMITAPFFSLKLLYPKKAVVCNLPWKNSLKYSKIKYIKIRVSVFHISCDEEVKERR